ncbi:hypothetical protein [Streptomyces avicenniae]|uniref:hypothetical protein n=1 Tax=Streptomyces avicenniae TaxID=500153 RepID=UPI00069C1665|nr:hypothetical protein [Streptomyces avicenniae]
MPFLIAALVLVGCLCLLDLLLTFAVLRRLREHTAELSRLGARERSLALDRDTVLLGRTLPGLAAEEADEERMVAFFEAKCDACHEHAPWFAATAADGSAAVVHGAGPRADELAAHVADLPTVIRHEEAASLVESVGITVFPTFLLVDRTGSVTRVTHDPAGLVATP